MQSGAWLRSPLSGIRLQFGGPSVLRTYLLSPPKTRLSMYLLVPALLLGASAASLTETAKAASPYVVDGVVLGSAFSGARQYQCRPSEQFAEFAWCQRSRFERARRETFSSSTSVLHGPAGVAYVTARFDRLSLGARIFRARLNDCPKNMACPHKNCDCRARKRFGCGHCRLGKSCARAGGEH